MHARLIAAVAVLASAPAVAQVPTPPDWRVALDGPAPVVAEATRSNPAIRFVEAPPGWHVTTRRGARLYHPGHWAGGPFSLAATISLSPGPSAAGVGLFLGAEVDDAGAPREQVAFLVRRDGSASVTRYGRSGPAPLVPWTRVATAEGGAEGGLEARLAVRAGRDDVAFLVNGRPFATVARTTAPVDGAFGLRVGPGLDVRVGALDLTHHLAPVRPRADPGDS